MEEEQQTSPAIEEGIPLIEGWMLGLLFFPLAMEAVAEYPPANDTEPAR